MAEAPAASSGPALASPRLPAGPGPLHPVRGSGPAACSSSRPASTIVARSWASTSVADSKDSTACCATGAARSRASTSRAPAGPRRLDINDRGQIVGTYSEDTPIVNNSARPRAYLLDRGRGHAHRFPGARRTVALGVNNRGQVVGEYLDAEGRPHGYPVGEGPVHDHRRARRQHNGGYRHQRSRRDRRHLRR